MPRHSNITSVQNLAREQAVVSEVKLEGTSTTYGQNIYFPTPVENNVHPTAQLTRGGEHQRNSRSQRVSSPTSLRVPRAISPTFVPPIEKPKNVKKPLPATVPEDVPVKVVQKVDELLEAVTELGTITGLPCKVKSNVAVAAASSNKNAVAVLPTQSLKLSTDRSTSLVGSTLNNFAMAVPNMVETAVVLGSEVKAREEIRQALTEAQKVDLTIALKSPKSEKLELNLIKTPSMEAEFVYNFFIESEEDINTQEDQSRDPLLTNRPVDTPRYVELKWSVADVTEPVAGTERIFQVNKAFRRNVFCRTRGTFGHNSTSFKNSIFKSKKIYNLLTRDGLTKSIVDIHAPEKAFNAIANEKTFANSICAVINTSNQGGDLSSLPIRTSPDENLQPELLQTLDLPSPAFNPGTGVVGPPVFTNPPLVAAVPNTVDTLPSSGRAGGSIPDSSGVSARDSAVPNTLTVAPGNARRPGGTPSSSGGGGR